MYFRMRMELCISLCVWNCVFPYAYGIVYFLMHMKLCISSHDPLVQKSIGPALDLKWLEVPVLRDHVFFWGGRGMEMRCISMCIGVNDNCGFCTFVLESIPFYFAGEIARIIHVLLFKSVGYLSRF